MANQTKKSQPTKVLAPKPPKPKNESKIDAVIIVKLDASDKILGRLATQIATILRGKDRSDFRPNILFNTKVIVSNAQKIKVSGKKYTDKLYYHHSGYIGSLKKETYGEVFRKDPREVLRRAVLGMLPKNKLQAKMMKNLEIRVGE